MKFSELIANNDVNYTRYLVDSNAIELLEKEVGVSFGKELTQYIMEYGYLAYKHIELYGINSRQMYESDMVKQTKYLNKYFKKTIGLIALENKGDGDYILVSSDDDIFEYYSEEDRIQRMELKLFDYIVKRFEEADK